MGDACGSDSVFSRVAIDYTSPSPAFSDFTSGDKAFQILPNAGIKFNEEQINPATLSGRIVEDAELTVDGLKYWDDGFGVLFTPETINSLIPYALGEAWGTTTANTSYPTDAAPADINILLHKDAYLYPYVLGKINTITISGEQGQPVQMQMTFLGRNRLTLETTWPSGLNVDVVAPYMFENCVVTVGGTTVKCRKWSVTRNNMLGRRHWGSTTPDCIKRDGKSKTQVTLTMPHSTDIVPLFVNHTPNTRRNVVITCTHPTAGMSCVINLPYTQFPRKDPPIGGPEILVETTGTARSYGGAKEMSVVNDNVPS